MASIVPPANTHQKFVAPVGGNPTRKTSSKRGTRRYPGMNRLAEAERSGMKGSETENGALLVGTAMTLVSFFLVPRVS
jgi:hypothetical protein